MKYKISSPKPITVKLPSTAANIRKHMDEVMVCAPEADTMKDSNSYKVHVRLVNVTSQTEPVRFSTCLSVTGCSTGRFE